MDRAVPHVRAMSSSKLKETMHCFYFATSFSGRVGNVDGHNLSILDPDLSSFSSLRLFFECPINLKTDDALKVKIFILFWYFIDFIFTRLRRMRLPALTHHINSATINGYTAKAPILLCIISKSVTFQFPILNCQNL